MRKKIIGFGIAVAILVAVGLAGFGGATAYAHENGHHNGCRDFGQFVANELAQNSFGHFLHDTARMNPGFVSGMVDDMGHEMCG